jgi:hypothetical protein
MGKESKLRSGYKPGETRQQYTNGDRKFYDRDAPIAGTDENVWHLMLWFEELLEGYGGSLKRPIAYTELYHRVSSDPDLTSVLERGTIHTSSKGEGGRPLVTSGKKVHSKQELVSVVDKVVLLEYMMYNYFNNYSSNTLPSIDNFCSYNIFSSLKEEVLSTAYTKLLSTSSNKIPVMTGIPQPDRRDKKTQEVLDITVNRVYTEQDIQEAFTRFREGHK